MVSSSSQRGSFLRVLFLLLAATVGASCASAPDEKTDGSLVADQASGLIELWENGKPAFGLLVAPEPSRGAALDGDGSRPTATVEGGRRIAGNSLLDFAFLDLEYTYDAAAVRAIAAGIRDASSHSPPALLVRIPSIAKDGAEAASRRVREVLALGADGVVFPHVRSTEEALAAVSFFAEAEANVWSPSNPDGDVIAMLMVEDPDVFADLEEIAQIPGYSILACGIGSLTSALDGDREAAEALSQQVLAHSKRVGKVDMITADTESVARRVQEGYLALLIYGPMADSVIQLGRAAAER